MTRVRPRARAKRTQFCEASKRRVMAKRTYFCVDKWGAVDVRIGLPAQSRCVYVKLVPTRIETVVTGPCASRTRFCGVVTYTSSGRVSRETLRIRPPYPFLRPGEVQKRTHFCASDPGRHRIREIASPSTRFCGDNRCAQTRGGITVRVNRRVRHFTVKSVPISASHKDRCKKAKAERPIARWAPSVPNSAAQQRASVPVSAQATDRRRRKPYPFLRPPKQVAGSQQSARARADVVRKRKTGADQERWSNDGIEGRGE